MYINFWSNDHLNGSIQLYILYQYFCCPYKGDDTCGLITRCRRLVDTLRLLLGGEQVGGWVGGSRSLFPGCQPILTSIFSQVYHLRYALNIVLTRLHYLVQFKDDHEGCAIRRSIFLAPGDSSSLQSRDNHQPIVVGFQLGILSTAQNGRPHIWSHDRPLWLSLWLRSLEICLWFPAT